MSKAGMIGSITRALPFVRGRHLGAIRDLANKLSGNDADAVHRTLAAALVKKPLPAGLVAIKRVQLNELRTATVFQNAETMSVPAMLQEILRLPAGVALDAVAPLMKIRGYALTEMQVEWLLDKQRKFLRGTQGGEDVGLRAKAIPNFFVTDIPFIARYGDGQWHRYQHPLSDDTEYLAGARLVLGGKCASHG